MPDRGEPLHKRVYVALILQSVDFISFEWQVKLDSRSRDGVMQSSCSVTDVRVTYKERGSAVVRIAFHNHIAAIHSVFKQNVLWRMHGKMIYCLLQQVILQEGIEAQNFMQYPDISELIFYHARLTNPNRRAYRTYFLPYFPLLQQKTHVNSRVAFWMQRASIF